ncbi:MAG: NfeD family protein [Wujia sp.]
MDTIIWLVVAAIMIIVEIITLGLSTVWFAGGALVTAIVAYCGGSWIAQIFVFALVSVALLIFTRPIAVKALAKNSELTNVDRYVGMTATAITDIGDSGKLGTVEINGMEWSAKTNSGETISKDSKVVIKAIEGNKLIVEKNH